MRQVPKKTYGIVGSGRTARHIKYYFQCQNILTRSWSRSENDDTPEYVLGSCDTILVLIKDSEIEKFIQSHDFLKTKQVVHFSGSLVISGTQSAHPLMTFGESLYSIETYKKMVFVCEKNKIGFKTLFPELNNTYYEIESDLKPFYHSLCVMAGNFTTLLWKKFFTDLEQKLDIPAKAAFPYLEKIVENLKANPDAALTGPLARRDHKTISDNLASLTGDKYKKVYQAFVESHDSKLLEPDQ